jgi:hypothetical protein
VREREGRRRGGARTRRRGGARACSSSSPPLSNDERPLCLLLGLGAFIIILDMSGGDLIIDAACASPESVVISRAFFFILLHNHIINIKNYFSFSGDVNYEANFSFFILLHKRAKPIALPYVHFSYPNLLSTFANPPWRLHSVGRCDFGPHLRQLWRLA